MLNASRFVLAIRLLAIAAGMLAGGAALTHLIVRMMDTLVTLATPAPALTAGALTVMALVVACYFLYQQVKPRAYNNKQEA